MTEGEEPSAMGKGGRAPSVRAAYGDLGRGDPAPGSVPVSEALGHRRGRAGGRTVGIFPLRVCEQGGSNKGLRSAESDLEDL